MICFIHLTLHDVRSTHHFYVGREGYSAHSSRRFTFTQSFLISESFNRWFNMAIQILRRVLRPAIHIFRIVRDTLVRRNFVIALSERCFFLLRITLILLLTRFLNSISVWCSKRLVHAVIANLNFLAETETFRAVEKSKPLHKVFGWG